MAFRRVALSVSSSRSFSAGGRSIIRGPPTIRKAAAHSRRHFASTPTGATSASPPSSAEESSSSSPQSTPPSTPLSASFDIPPSPAQDELSLTTHPNYSTNGEHGSSHPPPRIPPIPFHTHRVYTALEKIFPPTVANTLMGATRAILMERSERARNAALGKNDLENVCRPLLHHYLSVSKSSSCRRD